MRDPYVYNGTDVLENKLGIRDKETLDAAERDITAGKLMQISTVTGNFDYQHYKNMHEFIFGDIYDWAGKERTVPIEKAERVLDGMSVQYADPKQIKKQAEQSLTQMNKTDWSKLSLDEKASTFATNIAALWRAHPFREGNTRTAITFACEYADAHEFPMDRQIFADRAGHTRDSLVMASLGEYAEPEYLTKIFRTSMERGVEKIAAKTSRKMAKYDAIISDTSIPVIPDREDDAEKTI